MISSLFADLAGAIYAHLFVQWIPRGRADRFARTRPVGTVAPGARGSPLCAGGQCTRGAIRVDLVS